MNTRNKTSAMVESALITAIAVIFTLVSMYIPVLNVLLMFLPAPFIVIGAKNGLKYNILSLIAAGIMIGTFTGPLRAVIFLGTTGLSSAFMGYMIQKKNSSNLIILVGTIASIVGMIINFALMPKIFGFGPLEALENTFVQAREMYKGFSGFPGIDPAQLDQVLNVLDQMKKLALLVFPSSIIVGSVVTTYINYIASGSILRRTGFDIRKPNKLSHFRLPANFMMGSLVIVLLTYLANRFNIVKSVALNFNMMLLFQEIFTLQGLAVASFFLEKNNLGNGLRRTILVFAYIIPITRGISFFMGLTDVVLNIRKLES